MELSADPMTDELSNDGKAGRLDMGLHGMTDIRDPIAGFRLSDTSRE